MISYQRLIKRLKENNISQYRLKKEGTLGSATISKIYENNGLSGKAVDIRMIDRLCKILRCQPADVLECVPDIEESYTIQEKEMYVDWCRSQYSTIEEMEKALEECKAKMIDYEKQIESFGDYSTDDKEILMKIDMINTDRTFLSHIYIRRLTIGIEEIKNKQIEKP